MFLWKYLNLLYLYYLHQSSQKDLTRLRHQHISVNNLLIISSLISASIANTDPLLISPSISLFLFASTLFISTIVCYTYVASTGTSGSPIRRSAFAGGGGYGWISGWVWYTTPGKRSSISSCLWEILTY